MNEIIVDFSHLSEEEANKLAYILTNDTAPLDLLCPALAVPLMKALVEGCCGALVIQFNPQPDREPQFMKEIFHAGLWCTTAAGVCTDDDENLERFFLDLAGELERYIADTTDRLTGKEPQPASVH